MTQAIAIVGMACRYPDARSPQELWENVLSQRRAFRRIPSERLRLEDYYHPDRSHPDRTYSTQGAFLTNYEFDRVRFHISGSVYRSSDLAHWLALDIAAQALADAGFTDAHGLPTDSTGVLVGNTLTGELSRANSLRLRWPYVSRVVASALMQEGWTPEQSKAFLLQLEKAYKEPFAPVGEETLAGGLSNTIAGRICNYFNLKGGGYTIDGACSSSLLAIAHACSALRAYDIDVALAGGVDLSLDPFELIGFAKTAALAVEDMRVYDVRSSGFLPGEGCGFVVLMRHEEALAQQRHIYALIRGWGISSDGSGGITRPEVEGQRLALTRAYHRADFGIDTVQYFEGHGTGTAVGDVTELRALSSERHHARGAPPKHLAVIGSVKANIGHTKAAAGVAGLIKATMAISAQVLPPTTGTAEPHRELTHKEAVLQTLEQGLPWPAEAPLRAGVSAMGFGGINAHIVLEGDSQQRRRTLTPHEQILLASFQDAELILLSAQRSADLQQKVEHLLTLADRISHAELIDLAAYLSKNLQPGPVRAALVVSSPSELTLRLERLREWLCDDVTTHFDTKEGLYLSSGTNMPRIGFLFPGQGAPAHLSGGILRRRFPDVAALYLWAQLPQEGDGKQTEVAQPAITTASQAGLSVLETLGVTAHVGIGHSLGELTALHWSGVFDATTLLRIAGIRGRAMAEASDQSGAMLSIQADQQTVEELQRDYPVSIAGLNSPRQTVIAGNVLAVNKVAAHARARGFKCARLAVSHAFHSPLVAAAAESLADHLQQEAFSHPERPVASTVTGTLLGGEEDIKALLCNQITAPVRFIEAIARVQDAVDLFIEVGPGKILSGLTADISSKPVIATDSGGPSLKGLLSAVAAAFVLGAPVKHEALFEGRFSKPIDLNWRPAFLVNPCEQAPLLTIPGTGTLLSIDTEIERAIPEWHAESTSGSAVEIIQQIVAARAELPAAAIDIDSRLLSDLHLNSITVGQIVAEACRTLDMPPSGVPTDYADATLKEMAQALEDLKQSGGNLELAEQSRETPGLYPWIRAFTVTQQERALTTTLRTGQRGTWQLFAPTGYAFAQELRRALETTEGNGCIVCLPSKLEESLIALLLYGTQQVLAHRDTTHFVLVQHGNGGAAFARTLYLEQPHLTVCVVHLPERYPHTVDCVVTEVRAAQGYVEACYDAVGRRTEPILKPLALPTSSPALPLNTDDVLLVTGGGKGIAAECAFALARETGVRLALLGRSHPERDQELAENLNRMAAAHIRYHYVATDVQDSTAVKQAVREIENCLGTISAILHGAGSNVPRLLGSLDEAAVFNTLAPKVKGFQNVLGAVSSEHIRFLTTFGSVIARTGMQGEADYALANEWLACETEEFQQRHPDCHCLCIEWSVWSGVGMGERLGRVDALKRAGITPIPPDEGVALFRRLLAHRGPTTRVVVTGRFGESPTLKMGQRPLPLLRFLERPLIHYPGIELVTEAEVSTTTDLYLDDHKVQGERLLPAVLGLEAMAQAAQAVTCSEELPSFEHVQFARPIVVPEQKAITLRIVALVHESGSVEVVVRSSETAYQVDHFQTLCVFAKQPYVQQQELPQLTDLRQKGDADVPLQPLQDLYGHILFHRGRFTRIQRYRRLHATECIAEIAPYTNGKWFARYLPSQFILGDPAARDAVIHAIQACIPQATLLPTGVGAIVLAREQSQSPHTLTVFARERERNGSHFTYDVEVCDEQGRLQEQWQGLHLHQVNGTLPQGQWAEALLGPYLERRIAELQPGLRLQLSVQRDQGEEPRKRSDQALRTLIGTAVALHRRADGKPSLPAEASPTVSTAHTGPITLALTSPVAAGCDVETVVSRPHEVWQDLLGADRAALAAMLSAEGQEDYDTSATRVWAAGESLKKAGSAPDAPLMLTTIKEDGWHILQTGPFVVMTYSTRLRNQQQQVVFALCSKLL